MKFMESGFYISAAIVLYILASVISVFLRKNEKAANIVPNIFCIAAALSGIFASILRLAGKPGTAAIFNTNSPIPNMSLKLSVDPVSAIFILGLSALVMCVSVYSMGYVSHYYGKRDVGLFNFLYSGFILSILLVFTSSNMISFLIVWEIMSLLSYFLVVFESENGENCKAGTIYIVMTHIGTSFLTAAFVLLYCYTGSFDITLAATGLPGNVRDIVFVLLLIGFGTKAGIIPLHIWLPYAHPAASSNVSALMSGIMIKTAIYGLIRFIFCYMGVENTWWGVAILLLGAVSCFLGVAYALMEHNIKKLLAYHSIENIGIILIGLGAAIIGASLNNPVLYSLSITAALFHTINHALFKGGLFLGAGSIQYSTHTKDIEELGGLIKSMPYTSLFMLCFSMAICAIVPFNGFISEWLTYQSLFIGLGTDSTLIRLASILGVSVLALAGALALACFVKLFGISFLGRPRSSHSENAKEAPITMRIGMGLLAVLCTALGLFPQLFLRLADSTAVTVAGTSVTEKLRGRFMFLYYPANTDKFTVSPLLLLIMVVVIAILAICAVMLHGRKASSRKYGTWDCGFEKLTPRMQYTATGFSKPIRIVFRMLYHPGRELKVEEGKSPYYPRSLEYSVSTEKLFEKYMYSPALNILRGISKRLKFTIQTGSIHMYLLYIFITVIALMLYNGLSR